MSEHIYIRCIYHTELPTLMYSSNVGWYAKHIPDDKHSCSFLLCVSLKRFLPRKTTVNAIKNLTVLHFATLLFLCFCLYIYICLFIYFLIYLFMNLLGHTFASVKLIQIILYGNARIFPFRVLQGLINCFEMGNLIRHE